MNERGLLAIIHGDHERRDGYAVVFSTACYVIYAFELCETIYENRPNNGTIGLVIHIPWDVRKLGEEVLKWER